MAYRVQNHAFDLVLPVTNDALLITVDTNQKATCTHVPRQIPKDELQKLLPSSWITNYEKLHQNSVPIQSMEPEFTKKADGTVEIVFQKGASSTTPPAIFSSISMVQPIHEPLPVPIKSFSNTGLPVYSFAEDNHNFWDICHCDSCSNEAMTDEDDTPRHKRKSSGKKLKSRYINGDRTVDTLGQPSGKFDYLVKYTPPSWATPEQVPTVAMLLKLKLFSIGKAKMPLLKILFSIALNQGGPVQTNLKKMTVSVDSRILHLEELCAEIQQRISTIHEYLLLQASTGRRIDPQKEQEIQSLKIQLKSLQNELAKSKSKPSPFLNLHRIK
ncbi:movement protein [Salix suchowensis]|nr:movement protein [Salix suchowensis]